MIKRVRSLRKVEDDRNGIYYIQFHCKDDQSVQKQAVFFSEPVFAIKR